MNRKPNKIKQSKQPRTNYELINGFSDYFIEEIINQNNVSLLLQNSNTNGIENKFLRNRYQLP